MQARAACLVRDGICVGSALEGSAKGSRTGSEGRAREAEGVHDGLSWQWGCVAGGSSGEVAGRNLSAESIRDSASGRNFGHAVEHMTRSARSSPD